MVPSIIICWPLHLREPPTDCPIPRPTQPCGSQPTDGRTQRRGGVAQPVLKLSSQDPFRLAIEGRPRFSLPACRLVNRPVCSLMMARGGSGRADMSVLL